MAPSSQWSPAGNTSGFGQVWDGRPFWTGDFSGDGRTDILFYYPGDRNWWLGRWDGAQLQWSRAGDTSGFGQVWDGRPFWTGDFSVDGRTDLLFYYPGDYNWWLGQWDGAQLQWSNAGDTRGFGQVWDVRWGPGPFWTGDFSGDGRTDILFPSIDGTWWLGQWDGSRLQWSKVGAGGVPVYVPPPPPPPPPPPQVRVPKVVGLTVKAAGAALGAVGLRIGFVTNFTSETDPSRLKVVVQDPAAGAVVAAGRSVNLTVTAEQPQGVKSLTLSNEIAESRTLHIHHWNSSSGSWDEVGDLAIHASETVTFTDDAANMVVAVDDGLINCNDGRPDNISCARYEAVALGDDKGLELSDTIH
jgi:hypothetical protein